MYYGKVAGIDKPVTRIVFGTDRLPGRRRSWLPDRRLEQQAFSLLDRSLGLGCNSFDTARIYRDSERTLGTWLRERRNRDEVVIITKGCHPDGRGHPQLSSNVTRDLHASLDALSTDFIDVHLLQYDHSAAHVEPVMAQLNRRIDKDKIDAIGASNWSHERISSANTFAVSNGLQSFPASSV